MLSLALFAAEKKFWILDPLYAALGNMLAFFYALIPSYGFAIIMLTVAVSILRMPLVTKQVKSQQAMQRIQPELKRIQAKYKAEPQKRNEELMKLYKEHNVNPFAGCLPLLLQMPLFIVLYRTIMNLSATPPKHIPLGSDLSKDLIAAGGKLKDFGMDLAQKASEVSGAGKFPYILLVALVVGTGLFQARQMSARLPKDAMNSQMAIMSKIFPVFLGLISWSIPAGVVLYFIVSNLWQIGQQAVLFRHQPAGGGPLPAKGSNAKGGGAGGGGGKAKPGGSPAKPGGGPTRPESKAEADEPAGSDGPEPSRPVKQGFLARLAAAANQTPADRSAPPGAKPKPKPTAPSGGPKPKSRPPAGTKGPGGTANGKRAGKASSSDGGAKPSPNGRTSRPSGRAQPPKSAGQNAPKSRNQRRGK